VLDFQRGERGGAQSEQFLHGYPARWSPTPASLHLLTCSRGFVSIVRADSRGVGACGADGWLRRSLRNAFVSPPKRRPCSHRTFRPRRTTLPGLETADGGLDVRGGAPDTASRQRFTRGTPGGGASRSSRRMRLRFVEDVRKIRGPVEEMGPIMAESTELLGCSRSLRANSSSINRS